MGASPKTSGAVEILWTPRAKAVENLTAKFFSVGCSGDLVRRPLWTLPSRVASLDRWRRERRIVARSSISSRTTYVIVQLFEETINGRAYQIEATPVGNRWRAQLRRGPGVPTAMMPFYGQTPAEAARQLTNWLSLAHQRIAAAIPRPVPTL